MAELATIARPYAEALFKAADPAAAPAMTAQLQALAAVAAHPGLSRLADNPSITITQVVELVTTAARGTLDGPLANLLRVVVENGRLAALPEIAAQFNALVKARSGTADATVYSAFALTDAQLADLRGTLERRFGRQLNPSVVVEPGLIGGVRVVVGDEVLDTSVKARLESMRQVLSA
ncbi:MAG: F0F1 ATP synthase subunit delta [Aquabacterium sp.]